MILQPKSGLGLKVILILLGCILLSTGLSAITGFYSFKSLQKTELTAAGHWAQASQTLLKPIRLTTFKQVPSFEALNQSLYLVKLAPELEACWQQVSSNLNPEAVFDDKNNSSTPEVENQIITPQLTTTVKALNYHFQQFWQYAQRSLFFKHYFSQNQQQLLELRQQLDSIQTLLTHFGQEEHHVVILFANSDELRAGGGFIGSLAAISLQEGVITEPVFYDIYDLSNQIEPLQPAPIAVNQYLSQGQGLALTDANWQADFSQASQDILQLLDQTDLPATDLLLTINLDLIKDLLKITGPIHAPDISHQPNINSSPTDTEFSDNNSQSQVITTDNLSQIARQNRLEFFAGDKQKKHFLKHLYTVLKIELTQLESNQYLQLAAMLNNSLHAKNLLAYSSNSEIQQTFSDLGAAGALESNTDYFLYLPESNVGINKANQNVSRSYMIDIKHDDITVNTKFINSNQPLSTAEIELVQANPDLHQATHLGYVNYQRIITNLEITDVSIKCNNSAVKLEEQQSISTQQGQAQQIGFLITLPEQDQQTCQYHLKSKQKLNPNQTWTLFKQPGLPASEYQINFFDQTIKGKLEADLVF